jgi:hypothetical protein
MLLPEREVSRTGVHGVNFHISSGTLSGTLARGGEVTYEVTGFVSLRNPSILIMAKSLTQPLTEMSARSLPGGKGRPAL